MLATEKDQPRTKENKMPVCLNHTDTPAVISCATCGRPLCQKCIVKEAYCSENCYEKAAQAAIRTKSVLDSKARSDKRSAFVRSIVILIILAAAGAFAYYYFSSPANKAKVNYKLNQSMKQVKKAADGAVLRTDKALNKDSRYKKERQDLVK